MDDELFNLQQLIGAVRSHNYDLCAYLLSIGVDPVCDVGEETCALIKACVEVPPAVSLRFLKIFKTVNDGSALRLCWRRRQRSPVVIATRLFKKYVRVPVCVLVHNMPDHASTSAPFVAMKKWLRAFITAPGFLNESEGIPMFWRLFTGLYSSCYLDEIPEDCCHDLMRLLIEAGILDCDLGRETFFDCPADVLHEAYLSMDIPTVRHILNTGRHPVDNLPWNTESTTDPWSPLAWAVYKGSAELFDLLLEKGADPLQARFALEHDYEHFNMDRNNADVNRLYRRLVALIYHDVYCSDMESDRMDQETEEL